MNLRTSAIAAALAVAAPSLHAETIPIPFEGTKDGAVDGRDLPGDTSVTVANWMAGVIDNQAVPSTWPQLVMVQADKLGRFVTPMASPDMYVSMWVRNRLKTDCIVFQLDTKFYYIDDPAVVRQAAEFMDTPAMRQARDLSTPVSDLNKQMNAMLVEEEALRSKIATAPSDDTRADLRRQEAALGPQIGAMQHQIAQAMQTRRIFADAHKDEIAQTPQFKTQRYENIRALLAAALKTGTAKPADPVIATAGPSDQIPPNQGSGDFVLVSGNTLSTDGATEAEFVRAWKLRGKIGGDYVWFQDRWRYYYVTDPAAVARYKALLPTEADEERRRRMDEETGSLMQGQGDRLTALRAEQASLTDQESQIHTKAAAAYTPWMEDDLTKQESGILARLGAIEREIGEIGNERDIARHLETASARVRRDFPDQPHPPRPNVSEMIDTGLAKPAGP